MACSVVEATKCALLQLRSDDECMNIYGKTVKLAADNITLIPFSKASQTETLPKGKDHALNLTQRFNRDVVIYPQLAIKMIDIASRTKS